MQFNLRSRRLGATALGVTGLGAAAVALAAFPTVAQGAVAAVTSVSCSVTGTNWCISGNNSSSGIGVIGTSKNGTGLRGTSTSQYGLKATSSSNVAIYAQTTSGSNAITALAGSNGNGVNASAGGVGISGTSTGSGDGVLGYAKSGTGVYGGSSTGTGGYFSSASGVGVEAVTNNDRSAIFADNSGGNGAELIGTDYGIIGIASSYPLLLENATGNNNVFEVDSKGNVRYGGTLQSFARTIDGGTARSFSPNSTQPTVEDTGTAQLVRGTGVVRLDPTFAASIEPAAGYRVFVTPDGETHELFVASKSAAGFVVREAQAGRSTVMFDYRIVATKFGAASQHMALVSPAEARTLGAHFGVPVAPAVKLHARAGSTVAP